MLQYTVVEFTIDLRQQYQMTILILGWATFPCLLWSNKRLNNVPCHAKVIPLILFLWQQVPT